MIFTVNPMDFGDYVHPIARKFEDLFRLILGGADMAALEQCYAWDEEQYQAFLQDCPPTEEQKAALMRLQEASKVEPIENPFAYVKELQAGFDLSKIPYTEEYYDPDMNGAAPELQTEWEVYYGDSFFPHHGSGKPGEKIETEKTVFWENEIWYIPAVYVCGKGLVIDFCIGKEPRRGEDEEIDFTPHVTVNGKRLEANHGYGMSWTPVEYMEDGERNPMESNRVRSYYQLDETKTWNFYRWSCRWATSRKPNIRNLQLKLERNLPPVEGKRFRNPSVGDEISVIHPYSEKEYRLRIEDCHPETMEFSNMIEDECEHPTHFVQMEYSILPELSSESFLVVDCRRNDAPRRNRMRRKSNTETESEDVSIGIIGGADGPTVIVGVAIGNTHREKSGRIACSALTFEPQREIEWKILFYERREMEISLID